MVIIIIANTPHTTHDHIQNCHHHHQYSQHTSLLKAACCTWSNLVFPAMLALVLNCTWKLFHIMVCEKSILSLAQIDESSVLDCTWKFCLELFHIMVFLGQILRFSTIWKTLRLWDSLQSEKSRLWELYNLKNFETMKHFESSPLETPEGTLPPWSFQRKIKHNVIPMLL